MPAARLGAPPVAATADLGGPAEAAPPRQRERVGPGPAGEAGAAARPSGPFAAAAAALLARGWSPIPLRPRDKRPLSPWEPYRHRPPLPEELALWRSRWPEANVGIVTGAVSGLVVLDVDPEKGGEASLAALEAIFGRLPATLSVRTGGGGRHLYFAHPGKPVPCAVGLRPGLDVRGDGGYVVAPPSVHPSGRPYRFEGDGGRPPAPLPGWLAALLAEARRRPGHPIGWWRRLLREGLKEGERNTRLASLAGLLLHHGLEPGVVEELLQGWNLGRCRPPLPPEEVSGIVASICRTRERRGARPTRRGGEPPPVASPGRPV